MSKAHIKFGTDGWRAVIAEDFTFSNLDRVTQAAADYWRKHRGSKTRKRIVVGYDRRFLSDQFAARSAEVLAGNGFEVLLTPAPTSTPAVSFAVKKHQAAGGVMLTASHNPPRFNGFKLKAHYGGSADPAICQAVEGLLDQRPVQAMPLEEGLRTRRIQRRDATRDHLSAIKKCVDMEAIRASNLRFAHDPLFGVGDGCFDDLLRDSTCQVTTLNGEHDPFFGGINPEPVESNYGPTAAYLRRHPHDLCLVTDGDADRVGAMDGRGNALTTHHLICLLLKHLHGARGGQGRVVKALTVTSMVDKMCAEYGLPMVLTGVGFKYICAEMLKGGVLLGAEESGGIGFPGHIPERDGILAGLMLLEMLAHEGRSINQLLARLEKRYGPHRYARRDMHFPLEKRAKLMAYCGAHPPDRLLRSPVETVHTFDGVKYEARDGSWLMIRGSGTEPILRVYSEASSDTGARKLLDLGVRLTGQV